MYINVQLAAMLPKYSIFPWTSSALLFPILYQCPLSGYPDSPYSFLLPWSFLQAQFPCLESMSGLFLSEALGICPFCISFGLLTVLLSVCLQTAVP